jgi:predicted amidohydrolase
MGGIYYNSVAVLGPEGGIIEGELPTGGTRRTYSKVHVPEIESPTLKTDEKFFFKPGEGIPVFRTPKAVIGILLCFERRVPEAWRTLALQGAEIVFLPADVPAWVPTDQPGAAAKAVASSGDMFACELRAAASANMFFVVGCNKGGTETFCGKKTLFFGMSCVVNPSGGIMTQAPASEPALISATIDLEEVDRTRKVLRLYKDRKPELYLLWPKRLG